MRQIHRSGRFLQFNDLESVSGGLARHRHFSHIPVSISVVQSVGE